MPLCLECGKKLKSINYAHLKSCCGLTTRQYKLKHKNVVFMDDSVKESMAKFGSDNPNYKGQNRKKILCPLCGEEMSGNGEMCHTCAVKNGRYTHLHTEETKKRMSESAKNRDPSTRYKIPATKEIIEKREAAHKKTWDSLSEEEKHKRLENFIKAGNKKKKRTSIELKIKKYLDELGLKEGRDYKCNVDIGIYNVDFLVDEKYIIEAYGDYWHRNPDIFEDDIGKNEKDAKKKEWLEANGYEFCYFWESDINKDIKIVDEGVHSLFGYYYDLFDWESCVCG